MLFDVFVLIIGLGGLIWSADMLVDGASTIARCYGVSPLVIGLTIVALGTSAPEIMVALSASLKGQGGLAIGNAIGSNIANIGLVIGVTGLVSPVALQRSMLRIEYPVLFIIMLVSWLLMVDGTLSVLDGALLLTGCVAFMVYLYISSKKTRIVPVISSPNTTKNMFIRAAVIKLLAAVILLPIFSHILVDSAVNIARFIGVSEVVIGLTIIAIGTSLPELVTSVVAIVQGEEDIAIGNILGSNIFNLALVMAIPGLINSSSVTSDIIHRDIPVMVLLAVILLVFQLKTQKYLPRIGALLMLVVYFGYLIYLCLYS